VFDAARRASVDLLSDARRPDAILTAESERGVKPSAPPTATAARSHAQVRSAEHGERG